MDTTSTSDPAGGERTALLEELAQQRWFLLHTVEGLTDDQARLTPTASSLCLGGLVKHVALTERAWTDFVETGEMGGDPDPGAREREFRLLEDETLEGVVAMYREVAERTDALLRSCDLSAERELPPAPWFRPGERRSARRTFAHILAELAHHTGHADIIRESIDGQRSMG